MLPNVVPIYEDELIHSWLERLAIANGCSKTNELLACYHLRSKTKRVVSSHSYIAPILEAAEIENWAEMYVSHTEYAFVAPFVDDYHQMMLLDCAFANHPIRSNIKQFYVCPECQKENPYLRVWHNLTGVKVCHKHNTALIPVKSGLELVEPSDAPVSVEDVQYAKYCHDLHSAKLPYSVSYINRILGRKDKHKTVKENVIRELMRKYPSVSDLPKQITRNTPLPAGYTLLHQCGGVLDLEHECGKRYCMTVKGLETGFFCPSCNENLTEKEIVERFITTAGNGEYKLIELYESERKIKVFHKTCGAVFETSLRSFLSGSRCECKRIRTIGALRNLFASDYPDFIPVSKERQRVIIRHNACGKEFDLNWKDWVRNPTCRYCDPLRQPTYESLSQELDKIGLHLISFTEGSGRKLIVTVTCNNGHRTVAGFYYIRELGGCPQCQYTRDHSSSNLILKYLKENCQDRLFFFDDIADIFGPVRAKRAIQYMRNSKQIVVLAKACYKLSENNKEYTERDIITQKYLYRGDETIGYLYGQSFSYYVLEIGEKPEIVSIATKKDSSPKGDLVHYNNSVVRLRRVLADINEENWKAVQVADFINGIYLYWGGATKHIDVLFQYIEDNNISKDEILKHITNQRAVIQRIKRRLLG